MCVGITMLKVVLVGSLYLSLAGNLLAQEIFFQKLDKPILRLSEAESTLKEILISTEFAQEALDAFDQQQFPLFDPQVGDDLCQVRAAMVRDFVQKSTFNSASIRSVLQELQQQLMLLIQQERAIEQKFLEALKSARSRSIKMTLSMFLQQCSITNSLPAMDELKFLIACFMRTNKTSGIVERIAKRYGLLKEPIDKRKGLEKCLAGCVCAMTKSMRGFLNEQSINYMDTIASDALTQETNPVALTRLKELQKGLEQTGTMPGFKTVPCFVGLALLLEHAQFYQQPLVIQQKFVCTQGRHMIARLFVPDRHGYRCASTEEQERLKQAIAMIIRGKRFAGSFEQWKQLQLDERLVCEHGFSCSECMQQAETLEQLDIKTMLLTNAAKHPQFAGSNEHKCKAIDFAPLAAIAQTTDCTDSIVEQEFDAYKSRAESLGMCVENMSGFCIRHIYADKIAHALKEY